MKSANQLYLEDLTGTKCFCGNQKKRNQTFCKECYFRLPDDMRKSLYRRFNNDYEEAVDRAKEFLE